METGHMKEEKTSIAKEIISYIRLILVAALVGLIFSRCIIINAVIPSGSMENLLKKGDRLIGFRQAYLLKSPERYDVVMFHYPVDESRLYIKRVIGLPGETVSIEDGKIYIDDSDVPLEEDYLPEEWYSDCDGYEFDVPEGHYLMLGDNRNISEDARYWAEIALEEGLASGEEEAMEYAYVAKEKIVAKAVFKYSPKFVWLDGQ